MASEEVGREEEEGESARKGVQYQRVKRYAEQMYRKQRLKTCSSQEEDAAEIDKLGLIKLR